MEFTQYQKLASRTAEFNKDELEYKLMYLSLGLAGEAGEVVEKIKKLVRNDHTVLTEEKKLGIASEIGDALWYLSQLALLIGVDFEQVARMNLQKLADRQARGVLKSEGDNR